MTQEIRENLKAQLFSGKRYNGYKFFERRERDDIISDGEMVGDHTRSYQEDIQRIIHTASFRRLQNKTQVHPLPGSDYVRNRLTHSLEVSEVGQLIANAVARNLKSRELLPDSVSPADIKDIVASACLIHDLGNPPFGHNGEEAIQSWFKRNKKMKIVAEAFKNKQVKRDFLFFDGNAQTFRIVNRLQTWMNRGGMRLSIAAVGASVKYPWSSLCCYNKKKRTAKKKYGYLYEEAEIFESIFSELGLKREQERSKQPYYFIRHPLAYIVEAADDIAYLTTDIEDAVKFDYLDYERGKSLLMACSVPFHRSRLSNIEQQAEHEDDVISYLRGAAISTLADAAFSQFVYSKNLRRILDGNFNGSLLDGTEFAKAIGDIRGACREIVYTRREKLETELAGEHSIEKLLTCYMDAVNEFHKKKYQINDMDKKFRNYMYLLPPEILKDNLNNEGASALCYIVVDYISGMTDSHLTRLYRRYFMPSIN